MSKENVSIWLILNVHYCQHYSTVNHQGRSPQVKQQIKINNGVELLNAKKARQIKKSSLYHYLNQQITDTIEMRKSA